MHRLARENRLRIRRLVALGAVILAAGCTEGQDQSKTPTGEVVAPRYALVEPTGDASDESDGAITPRRLRRKLNILPRQGEFKVSGGRIVAADLRRTGVTSLEPLRGLPLEELYLERSAVSDLAPLKGMPLKKLYLNHTRVRDIAPLKGMSLDELNLFGTKLEDIDPVARLSVRTLWLKETGVEDLGPLRGKRLESLDVSDTPVGDVAPLRSMTSLKRLNIAGSNVTDLTPLDGLPLERLIFTPENIEQGLDVVRRMRTLRELDVTFREPRRLSPTEFWRSYDAGKVPE